MEAADDPPRTKISPAANAPKIAVRPADASRVSSRDPIATERTTTAIAAAIRARPSKACNVRLRGALLISCANPASLSEAGMLT
jgi:hypothetical protein